MQYFDDAIKPHDFECAHEVANFIQMHLVLGVDVKKWINRLHSLRTLL